jgi:hypothetical protein
MKVENVIVHGFRSSFRDWAGNVSSFPREVTETDGFLQPEDRYNEALSCIWLGSPKVKAEATKEQLRIRDINEQAGAIFALMPYLPKTFPREMLSDFEDESLVGPQIAGLTGIVKELAAAVSANSLTEVVDAASRQHSEWWVVEALIVTLRKVKAAAELGAVMKASNKIRNLDLRAKLVGRIASRSADLGYYSDAIQAASSIELPTLRAQELVELSARIAQVGSLDWAKEAASQVAEPHERSEAFMGIALELGAQGNSTEAKEIITRYVNSTRWKDRATQVLSLLAQSSSCGPSAVEKRIADRHVTDRGVPLTLQISEGISAVMKSLGPFPFFEEVRKAAMQDDAVNLHAAIQSLWKSEDGQKSVSEMLGQLTRPRALNNIRDLAPLVGFDRDEAEVVEIIRSIRNIGTWWP